MQAGETALPVLAAPIATGPEVSVVHCSAVASETTKYPTTSKMICADSPAGSAK